MWEGEIIMKIELENGKYTYMFDENTGVQEVLRYGEPLVEDLTGCNWSLAMAHEIQRLRKQQSYKEDFESECG